MKNVDYKTYISDPEIRCAIEREARRARNEAIGRFMVTPLVKACGRLLKLSLQATHLILTLANLHFYSPGRISGAEFNRSTQPRS